MFTVKDLAQRFHLPEKSVRERISALGGVVDGYITRGRNNAIMLSDAGLAIFDRLIQLEAEGYPTATAVDKLQDDGLDTEETTIEPTVNVSTTTLHPEMIDLLRDQIKSLQTDKAYLQQKLDEALERIPALPPGEESKSQSNHSLTRLQALRILVLGK